MSETYGALVSQLRARLDELTERQWLDRQLVQWCFDGAKEVAKKTESLRATASIAAVAGTQQYTLPTDAIRIHRVEYVNTGDATRYTLEYRDFDSMDCVDAETRALTRSGWRGFDELVAGDLIYTLNPETLIGEWRPIQKLHIYHEKCEAVLREGSNHSSLTTKNHRWFTKRGWKKATDYLTEIPRAAPAVVQTEAKFSDAFVELMGFFWTDGTIDKPVGLIHIYQSATGNPQNVSRVRAAIASEGFHISEVRGDHGMISFAFNRRGECEAFLEAAPGKIVDPAFVMALTAAQLRLFIDASLAGDGSVHSNTGQVRMAFKRESKRQSLAAFELALVLTGTAYHLYEQKDGTINVSLLRRSSWATMPKHSTIEYDDVMWCPSVENGIFLVQRNGKTYFTGNSIWWTQQTVTRDTPSFFTMWGYPPTMQMVTYPTPSHAGTFTIFYYKLPANPSLQSAPEDEICELPEGWTDVALDYATYMALLRDADDRWQIFKSLYDEHLADLEELAIRYTDMAGMIVSDSGAMVPRFIWDEGYY